MYSTKPSVRPSEGTGMLCNRKMRMGALVIIHGYFFNLFVPHLLSLYGLKIAEKRAKTVIKNKERVFTVKTNYTSYDTFARLPVLSHHLKTV